MTQKKRNKKYKGNSYLPVSKTPVADQTTLNKNWLKRFAIYACLIIFIPIFVSAAGTSLNSLLSGRALLQYVGSSPDRTLLFRIKNNLPFDIKVAEFNYKPAKIAITTNRDTRRGDVDFIYDGKGHVSGMVLKNDPGLDTKKIKDRLTDVVVKSGDENNFPLPVTFPDLATNEKFSFEVVYAVRPKNILLQIPYQLLTLFSVLQNTDSMFFVMDNKVVQAISETQFKKSIEEM
jgi:hypothetical protein